MVVRRSFSRSSGLRMRASSSLRSFEWFGAGIFDPAVTAGTLSSVAFVPNTSIQEMSRPTLLRLHGEVTCHIVAAEPGDVGSLWFGIELLPDSVPDANAEDPFTDIFSNRWLWHHSVPMVNSAANDVTLAARFTIDGKSKRKVSEMDKLMFCASLTTASGDFDAQYAATIRVLFAES